MGTLEPALSRNAIIAMATPPHWRHALPFTVGIIGLGELGSTLYNHISQYHTVWGLDLVKPKLGKPAPEPDVLHLCFPDTSSGGGEYVKAALDYISDYRPRTAIVESTIHVGVTRRIQSFTTTPVVHSPFRGCKSDIPEKPEESLASGLRRYSKIVAAVSREAAERVARYYQGMGIKTITYETPEETELAKLVEVGYYGAMLGFWQDVNRWCGDKGVSFKRIQDFVSSTTEESAFKHLRPRLYVDPQGIGGHCIIQDTAMLNEQFPESFFPRALLESNGRQVREYLESQSSRKLNSASPPTPSLN